MGKVTGVLFILSGIVIVGYGLVSPQDQEGTKLASAGKTQIATGGAPSIAVPTALTQQSATRSFSAETPWLRGQATIRTSHKLIQTAATPGARQSAASLKPNVLRSNQPKLISAAVKTTSEQVATSDRSRFADTKPINDDQRAMLARELQQELTRIGCYTGAIDGNWDRNSQRAMKAFTRSVDATLPVKEPDFILLTLVQGYSAKACGTPCALGRVPSQNGSCISPTIVAQTKRSGPSTNDKAVKDAKPSRVVARASANARNARPQKAASRRGRAKSVATKAKTRKSVVSPQLLAARRKALKKTASRRRLKPLPAGSCISPTIVAQTKRFVSLTNDKAVKDAKPSRVVARASANARNARPQKAASRRGRAKSVATKAKTRKSVVSPQLLAARRKALKKTASRRRLKPLPGRMAIRGPVPSRLGNTATERSKSRKPAQRQTSSWTSRIRSLLSEPSPRSKSLKKASRPHRAAVTVAPAAKPPILRSAPMRLSGPIIRTPSIVPQSSAAAIGLERITRRDHSARRTIGASDRTQASNREIDYTAERAEPEEELQQRRWKLRRALATKRQNRARDQQRYTTTAKEHFQRKSYLGAKARKHRARKLRRKKWRRRIFNDMSQFGS